MPAKKKKIEANAASAAPAADAAPNPPLLLQLADAKAMSQADRIGLFKEKDASASKLTIELGKLLVAIRADMDDPSQATAMLKRDYGIRPGTVNTASETARVFGALVPNLIAEAVFDTFTQGQLRAINRLSSGASKKRMLPEQIADLIGKNPDTFGEECDSLFNTGMTIAEAEKEIRDVADRMAAREKKAKEDADAAQKKKDDDAAAAVLAAQEAQAAAEAETARLQAEAEEAERQRLANPPPPPPVVELPVEVPAPAVVPLEGGTPSEDVPAPPVLVEGEHKGFESLAPAPAGPVAEQPRVIVPMTPVPVEPPATTEGKVAAADSLMEHLERILASLPDAERGVLCTRLTDMAVRHVPATGRVSVVPAKGRKRAA